MICLHKAKNKAKSYNNRKKCYKSLIVILLGKYNINLVMSFSDLNFIILFLPISLALYFGVLKIFKDSTKPADYVLFFASMIFYCIEALEFIPVLVCLLALNFFMPIGIEYYGRRYSSRKTKKFFFAVTIIIDCAAIFYFKFYIGKMPLGLSFYVFQMISYVVDIYYDRVPIEYNFVNMSNYVAMFPRLIQGPLGRYENFKRDLDKRKIGWSNAYKGIVSFIIGLSYKVIIADNVGLLWNTEINRIGYESISTPLAWLGAVAYSLKLYFDFYGYSLMAVGIAGILGFELPDNFNNPYASRSISEFWRRWHITLGLFFKDYVYIPMGGNRKKKYRTIINILMVWILTSIWHGSSLNYLVWGLMIFLFLVIEKLWLYKYLNGTNVVAKILSRVYVIFFIMLSWVVFAITDIKKVGVYFTRLFPFFKTDYISNVNPNDYIRYFGRYSVLLVIAIVLCIPAINNFITGIYKKKYSVPICLILFGVCIYCVGTGLSNPFMYASF